MVSQKKVWQKSNLNPLCAECPPRQAKGLEGRAALRRGQKMPLPDQDPLEILIWNNNPANIIPTDRTALLREARGSEGDRKRKGDNINKEMM